MKAHLAAFALASLAAAACSSSEQAISGQQPPGQIRAANEVAMIGCLQREADYRAVQGDTKGGVLGTGVGVANEYVLVDATPVAATGDARQASNAGVDPRTFSLTGRLEGDLGSAVGRMVEVVGVAEDGGDSNDLPQFTVTLSHAVRDFCPRR